MDNMTKMLLDRIAQLDRRLKDLERREAAGRIKVRYKRSTSQTIATTTLAILDFPTVDYDTHSAVTTGASWAFVAPRTDYYTILTAITFDTSIYWEQYESAYLYLYKNGSNHLQLDTFTFQTTLGNHYAFTLRGATEIYLAAGDSINLRVIQYSDQDLLTAASAAAVWVAISSR